MQYQASQHDFCQNPPFKVKAIVTGGYCLSASHVVHTVGPQLQRGSGLTGTQTRQLARCYRGVLDAVERLPATPDGGKRVTLCGVSTGLFAYPARDAAAVAVDAVADWLAGHEDTSITDVVFNTFTEEDHAPLSSLSSPLVRSDSLERARQWLRSADAVMVSAGGAGLSASVGLDYTSLALFARHFPGFLRYGLRTLYSVFGFNGWPTERVMAGVEGVPHPRLLARKVLATTRTSERPTLTGAYSFLQCLANCRPRRHGLVLALGCPFCRFCGGKMSICVRGGTWFNEFPFRDGERRWEGFRRGVVGDKKKTTVILELGVGTSTTGVLRWPNEDLVVRGDGSMKLIQGVALRPANFQL
ncbi:Protein-ADP-ribose hydrolase [Colletotrichum tanaceti]|uniref:Protein-ADP-ribose hydrolase n=1 Tax=Colletotrichum tanaceti TaxID=1306861 RepID=A0A4U6XTA7_9PEZI|nr:Protein-ADP-ribose hydrolase [Colletotrichum tanaceti]